MKWIMRVIVVALVGYHAVYFRPLDQKVLEEQVVVFDAQSYIETIWKQDLQSAYDSAHDLTALVNRLTQEPGRVFTQEAKALGIGNVGYFKVKGEGEVLKVNENNVELLVGDRAIELETEFIYGNAIRDASGLIRINDYDETSNFNNISEAINDKIRAEVIPDFRAKVGVGQRVRFQGAIELNKAHLNLGAIEVIPYALQMVP